MKDLVMRLTFAPCLLAVLLFAPLNANAHDTWVQINSPLVRVGDNVYVDLMLGNHGNNHRDFKLASKITLDKSTLQVVDPQGKVQDLKSKAIDTGFTAKEGFWSARVETQQPGLHVVSHTGEGGHGVVRGIRSGKTYFFASESLDRPGHSAVGFDKPLGHAIELVPLTDPAVVVAGQPIRVRVVYKGKPMANAHVAFIPRGQVLAEGTDEHFERHTDAEGIASFTPTEGNYLLITVHHTEPDEKGEGYDKTQYTATMTFLVPQKRASASQPVAQTK
jgi:uncharacterized GH25 family protein